MNAESQRKQERKMNSGSSPNDAFRGLDLVALDIDLDQRRRGNLVEQQTVGVDQKMVMPPRHARGDPGVDQVRPSEQIDEAVAGSKIDPRLPFRLGRVRKGHFCYRHASFLHRANSAVESAPSRRASQAKHF
jgi:hypothetical protein